jgi:hypothetical protein
MSLTGCSYPMDFDIDKNSISVPMKLERLQSWFEKFNLSE